MVRGSASLRYEMGEKKVNEVDFISQGMELDYRKVVKDIEDGHVEEMEFEQDIEDEGEENEEDEDGDEI
ncbi:hypothetical protein Tco_1010377 [Tanacetum coccineum]